MARGLWGVSEPIDLDGLALMVHSFIIGRQPEATRLMQAAKVCEEAGELIGSILKEDEGRELVDAPEDELADVMLAALCTAGFLGVESVSDLLENRWRQVRSRPSASEEGGK